MLPSEDTSHDVRHISFDLWLTLIRSASGFKRARAALLQEVFHLPQSLDEVEESIRHVDRAANYINELTGGNLDAFELVLWVVTTLHPAYTSVQESQLVEFYQRMEDLVMANPPLLMDERIPLVLSKLKERGIGLSVLSNTGFIKGQLLERVLGHLGIKDFFDFRLYSDEIGHSKPAAAAFSAVWEQVATKIKSPNEVLHVGDNPVADFRGAKSFGFQADIITPEPDYFFQYFTEHYDI